MTLYECEVASNRDKVEVSSGRKDAAGVHGVASEHELYLLPVHLELVIGRQIAVNLVTQLPGEHPQHLLAEETRAKKPQANADSLGLLQEREVVIGRHSPKDICIDRGKPVTRQTLEMGQDVEDVLLILRLQREAISMIVMGASARGRV
jgi:hypothetical protein